MTNNVFIDRTVADYLLMQDKSTIDLILQNVKPKRQIAITYKGQRYKLNPRVSDLFGIEWKWIIKIRQNLQEQNFKSVQEIIQGVFPIQTDEQFFNCSVFDVFAAYAWIVEEIISIYEVEKDKLHKKPNQKQISAGIEEFDQLDDVPSIDDIAGGDLTRWDEVLEMPYGKVLRKRLLSKIQADYNERYSKLK